MKFRGLERVLTTGASGMIGSYVDFGIRPDRNTLDITDEEAVMRYVMECRPSAILHLAGATDMERAEHEPAYAYELNVRGTYAVARAARAVGAVMVYVSTSRVFKGDKTEPYTEDDMPEPETQYGMTKHIGELIVANVAPEHLIARTSWVFGGGPGRDNKFYGKVMRQMNNPEIVAINDVRGSPTYGKDFIETLSRLLSEDARGVVHIANEGVATRYEVALAMTEMAGSAAHVRPVERGHFASGATLPPNESILSKRCTLRSWREALAEYLREEWGLRSESATIQS